MAIFLTLEAQERICNMLRVQFVISAASSLFAFYCLFTKTPLALREIRNYFISIEILLVTNDVFMEALWKPFAVIPAPAGYCVGILCRAGMTMKMGTVIYMILLINTGLLIIFCCLHRHQSIVLASSPLKLSEATLFIIRLVFIAYFNSLWLIYALFPSPNVEQLIDSYRPDVSWIRGRGAYHFEDSAGSSMRILAYGCFLGIVIAVFTTSLLFVHMLFFLHNGTDKSKSNIAAIRKSLFILFAQLILPLTLLAIPLVFVVLSLIFPAQFSFDLLFSMLHTTSLHPIGHNILLISLTHEYRRFVVSSLSRVWKRKASQVSQASGTRSNVMNDV